MCYIGPMEHLVVRLRELRKAAHLSQMELAERAHVTQKTISVLEIGKGRRVDFGVLERIAAVLGVSPGDLIAIEDRPAPTRRKKH